MDVDALFFDKMKANYTGIYISIGIELQRDKALMRQATDLHITITGEITDMMSSSSCNVRSMCSALRKLAVIFEEHPAFKSHIQFLINFAFFVEDNIRDIGRPR